MSSKSMSAVAGNETAATAVVPLQAAKVHRHETGHRSHLPILLRFSLELLSPESSADNVLRVI